VLMHLEFDHETKEFGEAHGIASSGPRMRRDREPIGLGDLSLVRSAPSVKSVASPQ
jgi:hypothetical protein